VAQLCTIGYGGWVGAEQNISKHAKTVVEKVLRDRLASVGFAGANIRPDRDTDGDPILVLDVNYKFSDQPISSKITFGLSTEVRKALLALGESRFPQIRHHFNEQQKIAPQKVPSASPPAGPSPQGDTDLL
jgi:hypothetical protein